MRRPARAPAPHDWRQRRERRAAASVRVNTWPCLQFLLRMLPPAVAATSPATARRCRAVRHACRHASASAGTATGRTALDEQLLGLLDRDARDAGSGSPSRTGASVAFLVLSELPQLPGLVRQPQLAEPRARSVSGLVAGRARRHLRVARLRPRCLEQVEQTDDQPPRIRPRSTRMATANVSTSADVDVARPRARRPRCASPRRCSDDRRAADQWASCANASLKNGSLSGSSGRLRSCRANRNTQTPARPAGSAMSIQ